MHEESQRGLTENCSNMVSVKALMQLCVVREVIYCFAYTFGNAATQGC